MAGDKALACQLCGDVFPQRWKAVKQGKRILGGKRLHVDRHMGRLRVEPSGNLNHLQGAFFPDSLWPIILPCLALGPYLVELRVLPCVHTHLLTKMNSSEEAYG